MSYTSPVNNAVNFTFTSGAYSAPASSAVNFTISSGVVTYQEKDHGTFKQNYNTYADKSSGTFKQAYLTYSAIDNSRFNQGYLTYTDKFLGKFNQGYSLYQESDAGRFNQGYSAWQDLEYGLLTQQQTFYALDNGTYVLGNQHTYPSIDAGLFGQRHLFSANDFGAYYARNTYYADDQGIYARRVKFTNKDSGAFKQGYATYSDKILGNFDQGYATYSDKILGNFDQGYALYCARDSGIKYQGLSPYTQQDAGLFQQNITSRYAGDDGVFRQNYATRYTKDGGIFEFVRRYSALEGGVFRQAQAGLDAYLLYRGIDAMPDLTATPWQVFTAPPFTTPAVASGHSYQFVLRKRNEFGLISQNTASWTATPGGPALAPSAPTGISIAPAAGGAISVSAIYDWQADGLNAADSFLIYSRSDGTDPNPATDTPTVITAWHGGANAALNWTSAAFSEGATIKVLVKTRRTGSGGADSANTSIVSTTATLIGPAAIKGSIIEAPGIGDQQGF